jgi:hypothetical protein
MPADAGPSRSSMVLDDRLRHRIQGLLAVWACQPHSPSRQDYLAAAAALESWRRDRPEAVLWSVPPVLLTATLDDGWGHGLEVIEALASAIGVRVARLGLLKTPEAILAACRRAPPDLLGLTVLQFDSDTAVAAIRGGLPPETTLVAGGAAYRYDEDFARRTATPVVARDGAAFLGFLLSYHPSPAGG